MVARLAGSRKPAANTRQTLSFFDFRGKGFANTSLAKRVSPIPLFLTGLGKYFATFARQKFRLSPDTLTRAPASIACLLVSALEHSVRRPCMDYCGSAAF